MSNPPSSSPATADSKPSPRRSTRAGRGQPVAGGGGSSSSGTDSPKPKRAAAGRVAKASGGRGGSSGGSTSTTKKRPVRGNWSADHLLCSDKSKLKDADLEALLSHPKAWSALTEEQQEQLRQLLPGSGLPQQVLKENSTFRSHLRMYQEELAAGRFDPVWLRDAQAAMEKRASGDFDAWKENEREKFWGQKQTVNYAVNAGDSAKWSIADMVKGGCFQVGDIWLIKRGLRLAGAQQSTVVEKEATITKLSPDDTLNFSYPPSQFKHSASANGTDKEFIGANNPNGLIRAITAEDGRAPANHRIGNAWRDIRCYRKNQDMGSLWDVRELFHNKQDAKK